MGIFIIIGFYCLGEFTHSFLHLPIPGAVIGMVYLYLYLLMHKGASFSLQRSGRLLISNLPLLLIPSSAGVVLCISLLEQQGLVIALILSTTIVFSLILTAWMMSRLQRRFYHEP
ncbi:MAG: CidA/LrgA family protein [Oleispira sp.]|nr:CidA/LrgA family protein [Oleispira sp.]MBL4882705.1 CidA/LrgA family protein [Oleispira sp.]